MKEKGETWGRVVLKEAATAKLAGWPPPRPPGGSGTEEVPAKTAEGPPPLPSDPARRPLCGAEGRAKSPKEGPKKRLPDDQVRDQVISQDKRRRSGSPRRKRREEGSARKDKSTGRRRDPSEDSSGARSPLGRVQGRKAHAPSAGGVQDERGPLPGGRLPGSETLQTRSRRRCRSSERRSEDRRSQCRVPGAKFEKEPGPADREPVGSRRRSGSPRGEVRGPVKRDSKGDEGLPSLKEKAEGRSRSTPGPRGGENSAESRWRKRPGRDNTPDHHRPRPRQKSESRSAPPERVKVKNKRRRKGQERSASMKSQQVRQTKREPSQGSRKSIKREPSRSPSERVSASPAAGECDVKPPASRFLREFLQQEETGNLSAAQLIRHLVLQLMETDSPLKEYMLWSLQSPTRREGRVLNLFPLPLWFDGREALTEILDEAQVRDQPGSWRNRGRTKSEAAKALRGNGLRAWHGLVVVALNHLYGDEPRGERPCAGGQATAAQEQALNTLWE